MTNQAATIKGSNGTLPLPRRWLGLFPASRVHGGPFRHAPSGMHGVCLLERADGMLEPGLDVHMPIEDFQVPRDVGEVGRGLRHVFTQLLRGRPVYVGCAGGWGRTGLMLALVAKVAGEPDPVAYVRQHYTPRAVETAAQERYVEQFDVKPLQRWLRVAALRHVRHRFLRSSNQAVLRA